jgi:hypothetical protein
MFDEALFSIERVEKYTDYHVYNNSRIHAEDGMGGGLGDSLTAKCYIHCSVRLAAALHMRHLFSKCPQPRHGNEYSTRLRAVEWVYSQHSLCSVNGGYVPLTCLYSV